MNIVKEYSPRNETNQGRLEFLKDKINHLLSNDIIITNDAAYYINNLKDFEKAVEFYDLFEKGELSKEEMSEKILKKLNKKSLSPLTTVVL